MEYNPYSCVHCDSVHRIETHKIRGNIASNFCRSCEKFTDRNVDEYLMLRDLSHIHSDGVFWKYKDLPDHKEIYIWKAYFLTSSYSPRDDCYSVLRLSDMNFTKKSVDCLVEVVPAWEVLKASFIKEN